MTDSRVDLILEEIIRLVLENHLSSNEIIVQAKSALSKLLIEEVRKIDREKYYGKRTDFVQDDWVKLDDVIKRIGEMVK